MKRCQSITNKLCSVSAIALLLISWQIVTSMGIIEGYLLPSPGDVVSAFFTDFSILMEHLKVTLSEALVGLFVGTTVGFLVAVIMDRFLYMYKAVYPLIILTQTVPTVAIAPLLVLWFGYDMAPKIILVVITTFFPIAIGLLNGFKSVDKDYVNLMRAMGATNGQIFFHVKIPVASSHFFAGLRISASYAVVGAVISEWLGGFAGLGVYMTRVKKAFDFDKMFAVIFLISIVSLLLIKLVDLLQKLCMPWDKNQVDEQEN